MHCCCFFLSQNKITRQGAMNHLHGLHELFLNILHCFIEDRIKVLDIMDDVIDEARQIKKENCPTSGKLTITTLVKSILSLHLYEVANLYKATDLHLVVS